MFWGKTVLHVYSIVAEKEVFFIQFKKMGQFIKIESD